MAALAKPIQRVILMGAMAAALTGCRKDDSAAESPASALPDVADQQSAHVLRQQGEDERAARVTAADPMTIAANAYQGGNPAAARDLGGLYNLCGGIEIRAFKGARLPAEWHPYEQACARLAPSLSRARTLEVKPFDHPDSQRVTALSALPADEPAREQGLEEVMRTSSIPEFRMEAAFSLLDGNRLREWGEDVLPPHNLDNGLALQMDAALLYGCRVGVDCSSDAFFTLGECAQTLTCTPGTSLQRVIELRRSPLEMQILRKVVDQLVRTGDG